MGSVRLPSGKRAKVPNGLTEGEVLELLWDKLPDGADKDAIGDKLETSGWGSAIGGTLGGIGGAIGGTFTAPFTAGIINPFTGGVAGSAGGAALGEAIEQWISGGRGETKDIGQAAIEGGAWGILPGAGGVAANALGKGGVKVAGQIIGSGLTGSALGAGIGGTTAALTGNDVASGIAIGAGTGFLGGAGRGVGRVVASDFAEGLSRSGNKALQAGSKPGARIIAGPNDYRVVNPITGRVTKVAGPVSQGSDSLLGRARGAVEGAIGAADKELFGSSTGSLKEDAFIAVKKFASGWVKKKVGRPTGAFQMAEAKRDIRRAALASLKRKFTRARGRAPDASEVGVLEEAADYAAADLKDYNFFKSRQTTPKPKVTSNSKGGWTDDAGNTFDAQGNHYGKSYAQGGKVNDILYGNYAQGGALSNKISKIHGEGYKAPGQAYAIAKSMGYAQGGDVSGILGEADGWKQEGQKYADQYGGGGGFDVSPSDLLDFIPIIGDLKGAYEVIQEIRKPNPNWLVVGALAGAGIIGLVPGIGDAAAIAIKKGARSAGKIAGKATADVIGHGRNLLDYDPAFVGRGTSASATHGVGADRTVMANYDDYGHYKYPKSEVTEQIAKDKAQHATEYASGNQWDFMGANNPEVKRINREAKIARASRKKRAPFMAAERSSMQEYLSKPHLSSLSDEDRYIEALSDYASSSSKKISRTKLQHVRDYLSASSRKGTDGRYYSNSNLYDRIEAATRAKLDKMF